MTRIYNEPQLDFCDVLIKPSISKISTRSEVSIIDTFSFCNSPKKLNGIPIFNSNMGVPGSLDVAKKLLENNCFATLHKFYSIEEIENFCSGLNSNLLSRLFLTCGVRKDFKDYKKLKNIIKKYDINICIDVANGYIESVCTLASVIKNDFPELVIMAGNIVTPDLFESYKKSGISILKLGIGNGSVCSTREKTGVGRPQFSTLIECCESAKKLNLLTCSDGGLNVPGDICKALGLADFVMSGSFFAGTDEANGYIKEKCFKTGEVIKGYFGYTDVIEVKKFKEYFGMASEKADTHFYKTPKEKRLYKTYEGRDVLIPYVGPVQSVLDDIFGSLNSALSYTGSKNLKEYKKNIAYYRVNNQFNTKFLL